MSTLLYIVKNWEGNGRYSLVYHCVEKTHRIIRGNGRQSLGDDIASSERIIAGDRETAVSYRIV